MHGITPVACSFFLAKLHIDSPTDEPDCNEIPKALEKLFEGFDSDGTYYDAGANKPTVENARAHGIICLPPTVTG